MKVLKQKTAVAFEFEGKTISFYELDGNLIIYSGDYGKLSFKKGLVKAKLDKGMNPKKAWKELLSGSAKPQSTEVIAIDLKK